MIFARICLLITLLSAPLSLKAASGKVAVFASGKDRDLEALCVAALSQDKGIGIIERRDLDQLLGEKALNAALSGAASEAGVGRLAGIDFIVSLRRNGQAVNLQVIDCSDGRILAQGTSTQDQLGERAATLLQQATTTTRPGNPAKIAVEDFQDGKDVNYRLPSEIRDKLVEAGFDVLDRSVIEHAAAEHEFEKSGLATGNLASLLGADYLVCGQIDGGKLRLQLLDAKKGRIIGTLDMAPERASAETVLLLEKHLEKPKPGPASILEPRVQIEALIPLYQGIKHYRDGDLPAALSFFWKAERLDDKFVEAIAWEARCYEAMNLPIFADAVRRYARECLVGRGVSVPTSNIPTDGITFLGVQSSEEQPLREMKTVDALVDIAPGKIVLPDELASYRQEYDSIVGGSDKAWLTAPGFLTRWSLRASPQPSDPKKLEWTLFDTLSGTIRSTATTSSEPDKSWSYLLRQLFVTADGSDKDQRKILPAHPMTPKSWTLDSNTDEDERNNLELLHTLALNPGEPSLSGKSFHGLDPRKQPRKRAPKRKYSVEEDFLNYALKETIRTSLPQDYPYRAWLDLDKIASFLKYDPSGLLYSGEKIDPVEALKSFVSTHPEDGPGAFARYMLLIETMDSMPPEERIQACHATVQALGNAKVQGTFEESNRLLDCARHLEILARLAAGHLDGVDRLPEDPFPTAVRPKLNIGDSTVGILWRLDDWQCNEWAKIPVPREQWKQEAIAAIHILGRGSHTTRIPPAWLEESPNSLALLSFCEKSAHEAANPFGLPMASPIDAAADRQNYMKIREYFLKNIPVWLRSVTNRSELMFLSQKVDQFLKHLTYYAYSSTLTDQEFYFVQSTLYRNVVEAAQRIGEDPTAYTNDYWPEMPRWVSPSIWNAWQQAKAYIGPYERMSQREMIAGGASFADSPTQDTAWWSFMNDDHGMNSEKYSEFALRHLGRMNELYHPDDISLASMLGEREAAFLLNYGIILFQGRHFQEAEPWFHLVASIPEGPLLSTNQSKEIRENARLYSASCLQKEGRLNEALSLGKTSLTASSHQSSPMRYITHIWPEGSSLRFDYDGFLNTVTMRLLRDIRLISSSHNLPENLKVFQIPLIGTPGNGNGDQATFFMRLPRGISKSQQEKIPLLVLNPSFNHGGGEYILDSNPWARFADDYGLCLLIPEFEYGNERPGGNWEYQQAANWSGKTLLEAVKWVGDRYPVKTDRFLIHGYGGGGIFASGFVRWAPERCLAASLSSFSNMDTSADGCIDLKPFADLRSLPLLVTCGERDDARMGLYNRKMVTERYAAEAKAAGVDVEWRTLPDTGHIPTHEMEQYVQDFFVRRAHLTKRAL
jgi:tetratricopeptide (TPR) repeat protein/predicted esterase